MTPRSFQSYKPPAIDSVQAQANAKTYLVSARALPPHVTPEWLARTYRLKIKTAEYMLIIERQRRVARGE